MCLNTSFTLANRVSAILSLYAYKSQSDERREIKHAPSVAWQYHQRYTSLVAAGVPECNYFWNPGYTMLRRASLILCSIEEGDRR